MEAARELSEATVKGAMLSAASTTVCQPRQAAMPEPVLGPWLSAQSVNIARHTAALRPFANGEFGTGSAAPSWSHVSAVNDLMGTLRRDLLRRSERVSRATRQARWAPTGAHLRRVVITKERAHHQVRAIEQVWDFYFELFGQ